MTTTGGRSQAGSVAEDPGARGDRGALDDPDVLDDPARGRRLLWRDAAGRVVRVELADGTTLRVRRDEAGGAFAVTAGDGSPLVSLTAPVAVPGALRAMGLTPAQAAEIDRTHRLDATDPGGATRTELRERTIRVERDGAVLRIDADDDGRPRRVTAPGYDDVACRWADGRWELRRLRGPALLTIAESPGGAEFAARLAGGGQLSWSEAAHDTTLRWSGADGAPIVDTHVDLAGRVTRRTWHGGRSLEYTRDERGRLTRWAETSPGARTAVHSRQYTGNDPSGQLADGARTVVRCDRGGRVVKLIGPASTVSYDYDANGRRVARSCRGHRTTYAYDPLGRLTAVATPEGAVEYGWDALGRRISVTVDGVGYREHRDTTGRLWSVTTAAGEPVCRFLWWDGRAVARCGADDAIDEVYLTDPFGTLLGVANAATGWEFRDAMQPPFGRVDAGVGWRPTLFGHIADGSTPLICFGGRELDPETGGFLTPDPWSGEPDDPRRLAGRPAAQLPAELPANGIHAYALSQHDPLSRPDRDGHFAVFNFILTLMLGPTWGATLTSLSVFLFAPLNFYFELIGLCGYFGGRHLWPQHSIFGLRGATGSARLGTMGLALNGFVPRGFAGVSGDRCITIGHVAWESRHYFRQLDRARVLELDDISGTPKPDGTPSLDGRALSSAPNGSILAITSTDADRRTWVHASWWTRGPGNAVGDRGGQQTFEDRVAPGGPHARGTVFLAQPMPESMPAPRAETDAATLRVDEYGVAGGHASTAELVPHVWFAVNVASDAGIAAGTVVGVSAGPLAAAYATVLTVVPGAQHVAILDHQLPGRFTARPDLRDSVTVRRLAVSTVTSNGWALRAGAPGKNRIDLAAPGHPVAVGDVYQCAPTAGAPPGRPNAHTAVEAVSVALTVSPTLGPAAVAGSTLYRLAPDGSAANGAYADPVGQPAQIAFAGEQPFAVGDLVQVAAGPGNRYGRVTAVADGAPAGPPGPGGAPGKPATPATITLDEPLTGLVAGPVKVARLKETDRERDKGANTTQAGDVLTVKVDSTALFAAGQPVLVDSAPPRVREISAIGAVGVDTVDELVGSGPFTLTKCAPAGPAMGAELSSDRFLRHKAGDLPSAYGAWPNEIMGLAPTIPAPGAGPGFTADRRPSGWRYFLQANPPPADMHPDYRDYWQPVTVEGSHYWLLSGGLKITQSDSKHFWEPDADDHPRRYQQEIAPDASGAFQLDVLGFAKTAVTRPDAGGGRVFAHPAEAQVPEEPRARWSLADSLADHELTHTLQNTWWGPLLGALPLQGAFRTVRDVLTANNVSRDDVKWMDYHPFEDAGAAGFEDSNWLEIASIGGLMQIIWSFVILGPALPSDEARNAILSTNFDDWSSVFNPVNQQIINQIPKVRHDVPDSQDWKVVLGRALTRALDMKAWTPFLGFIKLMLPDGPRNFLEQQASRKSGNLYSTLLSVDDKFNAQLAIAPNMTDADVTEQLGGAVRLMSYASGFLSRTTRLAGCDAPGSHLLTFNDFFSFGAAAPILQFTPSVDALLPADLYEPVAAGAAVTPLAVDGPPLGAGPNLTRLLRVPQNTAMRPRLRAIAPIPPRVWQALGCYLVPASPAVWSATAPDALAHPAGGDAHTAEAAITVDSRVTLGSEDVPWAEPPATGVAPTGPKVVRFVTEKQQLTVSGHNTTGWQAVGGSGVTVTPRPAGGGWDLAVDPPAAGVALPTDVRVRVWAPVRPADANLFDLDHPDVPTLAGVRSYLDADIWIPVRDFLVTVTDLPALPVGGPPAAMTANGSYALDLPVTVAGPASVVVAGGVLRASRVGDRPPRGERWEFTAAGDRFVEAARVVGVVVRFAPGVERAFDITVNPNFTLDAPTFEATPAAPLALAINGGTAPFTVVGQPPAAARTTVAITGATATVTVEPPPAVPPGGAAPPAVAPITWKLKVSDAAGNLGARTLTLKP